MTALADEHLAHPARVVPDQRNRHLRSRSGSRSNFAASSSMSARVRSGVVVGHSVPVLARTSSTATVADGSGRGFPRQATAGHASRSNGEPNRPPDRGHPGGGAPASRTSATGSDGGAGDLGAVLDDGGEGPGSGHSRTARVGQGRSVVGRSLTLPQTPTHTQSPDPAQARPARRQRFGVISAVIISLILCLISGLIRGD